MLKENIRALSERFYDRIVADRHYLHRHPELSFQEKETSAYIKTRLTEMDIPWSAVAGTGVLGIITGERPSDQVIALRADIDALPLQEQNEVPYKSVNDGVMHACGHDVHTSSLLGSARILQALKKDFGGTVKLLFQPAEEKFPGGSLSMIADGVLENPKPQSVIGQHTMPELQAGKVGMRAGRYMASNDELFITVRGKGGHGAQPQLNVDPVVITAYIITALQQLVSRMGDPKIPTVLSFGKVLAAGATNIIPNEVYLEGTLRTFDESWRKEAHEKIIKMSIGIAESMGAACDVKIQGFPGVVNNEFLTARLREYAADYLGEDNVVDLDSWMAGEDFGEYAGRVDGCFYRIGVGNVEKGIGSSLHSPLFDIDEKAVFSVSSGLMAYIAVRKLGNT